MLSAFTGRAYPSSVFFNVYNPKLFIMKRWHANLLLLIAGAIWGIGFVAQAQAMDSIGPFLFIGLRFLVASVVVLPFAIRESLWHKQVMTQEGATPAGYPELRRLDWLKFVLIGLALFAGIATQQVGLLTTSVTNSGFLTGLYVVFTPLLAVLLFKEKPHPIVWFAALLSLAGIYLLSGGNAEQLVIGDLLTIASAGFWALQVVMIARFVGQSGRPLALSLTQFMVTCVIALLIAVVIEPIVWSAIKDAGVQILYAGIFASGFAFTLQVIGQRYTSAPQAAIFLSSEAPFAAFFAFLWLDERLALIGLAGCGFILCAMLSVELVPQWQLNRGSTARSSTNRAQE